LRLEGLVEACEDTRDMFGWDAVEDIVEEINDALLFWLEDDNDDDDDDNKKKMKKNRKYVGGVDLTPFSRFSFKSTTLLDPRTTRYEINYKFGNRINVDFIVEYNADNPYRVLEITTAAAMKSMKKKKTKKEMFKDTE
jgi:hypothetical protein